MKLAWPFGTVFLEKYGYDLAETDDEVELWRDVKGWKVGIKFVSGGDNLVRYMGFVTCGG